MEAENVTWIYRKHDSKWMLMYIIVNNLTHSSEQLYRVTCKMCFELVLLPPSEYNLKHQTEGFCHFALIFNNSRIWPHQKQPKQNYKLWHSKYWNTLNINDCWLVKFLRVDFSFNVWANWLKSDCTNYHIRGWMMPVNFKCFSPLSLF